MFYVFYSSYRNTRESLRKLEEAVETLACRLAFPQHLLFSQTSTRVSIKQLDNELEISIA